MYFLNSNYSKHQQEQKKLRILLTASFATSAIFHGVLFIFIPRWFPQKQSNKVDKPIELVLVDKPKPLKKEAATQPKPPKPKPESTPPPKVENPQPKPEPTPPPKVETPKPKKVLTTPDVTPSNTAPAPPVEPNPPASNNEAIEETTTEETVATNSSPPEVAEPITNSAGISCIANCQPEYPSLLDGDEGSAGIRLTIAPDGKVERTELTNPHSNTMLNRQAILAARQMEFNEIDNEGGALVAVRINFTVEGSEFDNQAREKQEQLEEERQAKLEKQRQQKLEAQRQEQEQKRAELEKQRQENLQQQQTENTNNLTKEELEAERIRKFRERIQNYN